MAFSIRYVFVFYMPSQRTDIQLVYIHIRLNKIILAVVLTNLLILWEGNPLWEIVAAELLEVVPAERPKGLDVRSL